MVEQIDLNKFSSAATRPITRNFQVGQILYGKILQLYPNNLAEIWLNGEKVVAQLDKPLSVGDQHYFEVTENGRTPQLQIVGGVKNNQHKQMNIAQLLQTLGLKPTKINKSLVSEIMQKKITFTKDQLAEAIKLFHGATDKTLAKQLIYQMISRSYPIKTAVFQALQAKNNETLTTLLHTITTEFKASNIQSKEMDSFLSISDKLLQNKEPNAVSAWNRQPSANQVEKLVELIIRNGNRQLAKQFGKKAFEKGALDKPQALPVLEKNLTALISSLSANKTDIQQAANQFVTRWQPVITNVLMAVQTIDFKSFTMMQKDAMNLFAIFFNQNEKSITTEPDMLAAKQWLAFAKGLDNEQTYKWLEQLNIDGNTTAWDRHEQLQQHFINNVTKFLKLFGLDNEYQVLQPENLSTESTTMKSALLQLLLQHQQLPGKEHAIQLLHYMNGAQLDGVQELNNQLFATIQIPGQALGLKNDFKLEAEGHKDSDGKLDKDFCRILFYLQLSSLKETIIDMNVQKSAVNITVFSNHKSISALGDSFKPLLSSSLNEIDYHLSSLQFKTLKQDEHLSGEKIRAQKRTSVLQTKGVDWRI